MSGIAIGLAGQVWLILAILAIWMVQLYRRGFFSAANSESGSVVKPESVWKSTFVLFFLLVVLYFTGHLNLRSAELAPFQDGQTFTYKADGTGILSTPDINVFVHKSGDKLGVIYSYEGFAETFHVPIDRYGKMLVTGHEGDYIELPQPDGCALWLPVRFMKEGAEYKIFRVLKQQHWKNWEVRPLQASALGVTVNWFYDRNTGYLVGCEAPGRSVVLIKSNVPGLVAGFKLAVATTTL